MSGPQINKMKQNPLRLLFFVVILMTNFFKFGSKTEQGPLIPYIEQLLVPRYVVFFVNVG